MSDAGQKHCSREEIECAVGILRQGGLVAFPTETYYGLAADPFQEDALNRLFALKRRRPEKSILLLINDPEQLSRLVASVPPAYLGLMERFWPGPLTLVFPGVSGLSPLLTGNTGTVGIRISSHPVARRIVDACGFPLTATSANISGLPPAATAAAVRQQFGRELDYILDGGTTPGGLCSTVVKHESGRLLLVRPGATPAAAIDRQLGGGVRLDQAPFSNQAAD